MAALRPLHPARPRPPIEHTWVSEATRGLETVVTITLAPHAGGTEVTLHHANVPDDDMGRGHQEGWTWYLNVLAERFEKAGREARLNRPEHHSTQRA